jgi:hypothetical protein
MCRQDRMLPQFFCLSLTLDLFCSTAPALFGPYFARPLYFLSTLASFPPFFFFALPSFIRVSLLLASYRALARNPPLTHPARCAQLLLLLEASGGGVRPLDVEVLWAVAGRARALWISECSSVGWPGRDGAGRLEFFLTACESFVDPDTAGSMRAHARVLTRTRMMIHSITQGKCAAMRARRPGVRVAVDTVAGSRQTVAGC